MDSSSVERYSGTPLGYASPAQLASLYEYSNLLQKASLQPVRHWTQGLEKIANALVGGNQGYQADQLLRDYNKNKMNQWNRYGREQAATDDAAAPAAPAYRPPAAPAPASPPTYRQGGGPDPTMPIYGGVQWSPGMTGNPVAGVAQPDLDVTPAQRDYIAALMGGPQAPWQVPGG